MKESAFFLPGYKLYCECIQPENKVSKGIIVMVPGGAHTGACYKTTPDGRQGWAYDFAEAGYTIYLLDWPGVGRSGHIEPDKLNGSWVVEAIQALIKLIGSEVILVFHSMSGPFGWKLLESDSEKINQLIAIAPGQMGNIQPTPKMLNQTKDSVEVMFGPIKYHLNLREGFVCSPEYARKKFVGESKLFPEANFDNYFASLVPIPSRILYERLNIESSQLKVDTAKLKDIKTKVTIFTGTNDLDHSRKEDGKIQDFLVQAGVKSEFIWLGDKGIEGNGHMMMQETNSQKIAKLIIKRLSET